MKIKITIKPDSDSIFGGTLTTPCPFGKSAMVGSLACSKCEHSKRYDKEYVYCAKGDKRRKRTEGGE